MRLLTFDLDDTLMWCGADYTHAKQRFGEFIAQKVDNVERDEAIETLDRIDKKNVEKHGLGMDRFPQSFVDASQQYLDNPSEEELTYARMIGKSVFKATEEYAERGFMPGVERILQTLVPLDVELHVITAGDERVQQRKINGLQLDRYFDDTHIVPIGTKSDTLTTLMDNGGYAPDETSHVGNSLTSDVKAALDANANAVYLPTHEWMDVENAEYYRTHERVTIYESTEVLAEDVPEPFLPRKVA